MRPVLGYVLFAVMADTRETSHTTQTWFRDYPIPSAHISWPELNQKVFKKSVGKTLPHRGEEKGWAQVEQDSSLLSVGHGLSDSCP